MEVAELNGFALSAMALKFLALFWSVRLYNRMRDARMGALAIVLAISLAWTIVTYAPVQLRVWMMSPAYIRNIPSVTIGILMLLIVMCLARVIEEEREQDRTLSLSRFALDRNLHATFILDESADFVYVNDAACSYLGYSREELLEANLYEVTVDLVPGFWKQHWRQLKQNSAVTLENNYRTKAGDIVPSMVSSNYMEHQGIGYDCAVVSDMTEQHSAEEALQTKEEALKHQGESVAELVRDPLLSSGDLEESFKRIAKTAADTLEVERVGIWIYDKERTGIRCLKLYERSKNTYSDGAELRAADYPNYFHSLEADRVVATRRADTDERTAEFADDYLRPLGITSMLDVPVRRDSRVAGIVCHEHVGPERDWTMEEQAFAASVADLAALAIESYERKKAEELLEVSKAEAEHADRVKSEFLGRVSRQIRTPMNGILGMTELLLSTGLSAKQKEFADTIRSSADSLLNVMNDVLRFSGEDDDNALAVDTVDFDLRAIVEEVVALAAEEAHAKRLELSAAVGGGVPTKLVGDPMRLWQVLTTIVGNAVRFTESGEVLARVSKESETATHVIMKFEVADTGVGMDTTRQREVFADPGDGQRLSGNRLGLVICKRIVEALGGEIGFYSEPDRGSTFWFTMLFEKNLPARAARPIVDQVLRDSNILVVDDSPTSQAILIDFLNAVSIRNTAVSGSDDAMKVLKSAAVDSAAYDLVIVDQHMPGTDGLELSKSIKADAKLHDTKILLLSNAGDPLGDERMRKLGIAAETSKPVKMSQFFDALAKAAGVENKAVHDGPEATIEAYLGTNGNGADSRSARTGGRVLVADDNVVNQKVALIQLHKLGCEPVAVSTGFEVLDALEREDYDLVLMDCKMHDMDGYETTAEIRRREFSARDIPIIGTIAHPLEGDHEQCIVAGMNDTLNKPLKTDELKAVIEGWISSDHDYDRQPGHDSDTVPQLDIERMRGVCEGDSAGLSELIESYLRHTQAQLESLYIAIRLGTNSEVDRIAKSCIDASESCGITAIVPTLRALQDASKTGEAGQAELLGRALDAEFQKVRSFLGSADPERLLEGAGTESPGA